MNNITVKRGKVIAIEGVDGCGKTTLFNKLKERYEDDDRFVFVREPGGTPLAEMIRKIIKSDKVTTRNDDIDAFLFAAARIDLYENVVNPALEQGKVVISDRSIVSSLALQTMNCEDEESMHRQMDKIVNLNNNVHLDDIFTVFLTCNPKDIIYRIRNRDEVDKRDSTDITEIDNKNKAFLDAVIYNQIKHILLDVDILKDIDLVLQLLMDILYRNPESTTYDIRRALDYIWVNV